MTTFRHLEHTSNMECHDTYIGNNPWTEPETRAIRDFVLYGAGAKFEVKTTIEL